MVSPNGPTADPPTNNAPNSNNNPNSFPLTQIKSLIRIMVILSVVVVMIVVALGVILILHVTDDSSSDSFDVMATSQPSTPVPTTPMPTNMPTIWSPQQVIKLVAAASNGDGFGYSVAVDDTTLVVGAPFEGNSGSVYVYTKNAGGVWMQQAKLTPSSSGLDNFGRSVAMEGDTIVVGSPLDDDLGSDSGSVYIFVRSSSSTWTQQAKLTPSDGNAFDEFGFAVDISGDSVIVGAPRNDDGGSESGSAYIFVRTSTAVWTEQAKLTASDDEGLDRFGWSVGLYENTAVVGAYWDIEGGMDSGSAYVFERSSSNVWTQQAKLNSDDAEGFDNFGWSVAVGMDTIVVGAPRDDDTTMSSGGALDDDSFAVMDSGSVYVFVRTIAGGWNQQAKLTASDASAGNFFGTSVAMNASGDDRILVGSPFDDDGGDNSGSAYVFTRIGSTWSERIKIKAADGAADDLFGGSVAISGNSIVVGAAGDDTDSGSVYVFE